MILKGSQRSGATQLSAHLLNECDNDHVTTLEVRGYVASDLRGALSEMHAVAKVTKCKQFMFSLSLNPPQGEEVREQAFIAAADIAEKELGLEGQPRAIVMHEKNGRRHAHVVWSRIDGQKLTAINLPFFKRKLTSLSKELYLENGWKLPDGLKANGGKNPLNFNHNEWQQAQRLKLDPREIKGVFQDAWKRSDSLKGLGNALAEKGYFLAKGDRRGFVAVDVNGEVYSLSRWIGVRAKELRNIFGDAEVLEGVSDVKAAIRARVTTQLKSFISQTKERQTTEKSPLEEMRGQMVTTQKAERAQLKTKQAERWANETKVRSARYRKGLKGLLDILMGRTRNIRKENEIEVLNGLKRDRQQRDDLSLAHQRERQELQSQFDHLKAKHARERGVLARDVTQYLRKLESRSPGEIREKSRTHEAEKPSPTRSPNRGPDYPI